MLRDLDLSVAAFLGRLLPAGTAIDFGPPQSASGAAAPDGVPLLGAFLYDVRETQPRATASMLARDEDGRATGWQRPVRRYQVSYLLMAWPDRALANGSAHRPGQRRPRPATGPSAVSEAISETVTQTAVQAVSEHELLGSVLAGCATADSIPPDCLCGVLAGAGEVVPLVCAAADRAVDAIMLWSVLGVPARTALDLKVVAPVVPPLLTNLEAGVSAVEMGLRRKTPPPEPPEDVPRPQRHITEQ